MLYSVYLLELSHHGYQRLNDDVDFALLKPLEEKSTTRLTYLVTYLQADTRKYPTPALFGSAIARSFEKLPQEWWSSLPYATSSAMYMGASCYSAKNDRNFYRGNVLKNHLNCGIVSNTYPRA